MHRSIDDSWSNRVHANAMLRIFDARLRVIASMPPFVIIGTDEFTPAIGCSARLRS